MTPRRWVGLATVLVLGAVLLWWIEPSETVPDARAARSPGRPIDRPSTHHGCSHPYVPTIVGTILEYSFSSARGDADVTMRLERTLDHGPETMLVWAIDTHTPTVDQHVTLARECGSRGAEEPWLGLGLAEVITMSHQDWRMPDPLASGDRFGGTYRLSLGGHDTTMTREQVVEGAESIEVDGELHDTMRIAIAERTPGAAEPMRSTAWIERGIGLVRLDRDAATPSAGRFELRHATIPSE